jgi:uncharacterized protein YbaR (Trm112 family)
MKLYCPSCGVLTGDVVIGVEIKKGIRKGAKLVCEQCFERYKIADQMAKMSKNQTTNGMPDFFKNIFPGIK